MPNPADKFNEVSKSAFTSSNYEGGKDLRAMLDFIEKSYRYNAIIKSHDTDTGGIYTVDVFDGSFSDEPTKVDIEAIALDEPLRLKTNMPCQVIRLRNDLMGIPRPTKFFHFKITNDDYDYENFSNFIQGIPCSSLGDTVLTEKLVLDLEYPYPQNQVKSETLRIPDPDTIVLVQMYDVPITYDADNGIAETTSFGLIMSPLRYDIPAGELQAQHLVDVVANEAGWDYGRTHNLPPNA